MLISDIDLLNLRKDIKTRMSEKRFQHTLAVERMSKYLAKFLLHDRINEVCAAALLHDVAKEIPLDEQIPMLIKSGFELTEEDLETPGIIHSFTAPLIIKRDFGNFATNDILTATLNHTVGSDNMSVFDKIIFISDYTEETRTYGSCIAVREFLLKGFENLSDNEKLLRLNEACRLSLEATAEAIAKSGERINSRMKMAGKSFLN